MLAARLADIPRKRWRRLMPVAIIMYTISFMDRVNIGFAVPGMKATFHMSSATAGLALGVFFFGYFVLQIPGGQWAYRWSAKRFILVMLLIWGILAAGTGIVTNPTMLIAVRFLLGVAEGGIWPAMLILIRNWFPQEERAQANALWITCLPIASAITSPISGLLIHWVGWRMMFILEGLPPFFWAILWWYAVEDHPSQAKWLSATERNYLVTRLAEEKQMERLPVKSTVAAVFHPAVLWLSLYYFLSVMGGFTLTLWAPSIIKSMGVGIVGVGLLLAIPNLVAIVTMLVVSRMSDASGKRKIYVVWTVLIASLGYFLLDYMLGVAHYTEPALAVFFMTVTIAFFYARQGPMWAIPSQVLPAEVTGAGMGMINAIGNLGGFLGPYAVGYFKTVTHSYVDGLFILGLSLVLAAVVIAFIRERVGTVATPDLAVKA